MTALGISLGWSVREDVDRVVDVVRRAEDSGVDACWVIDSQLAMRDAFALLTVLARETGHIRLGSGVTNLVTRHETVLAATFATLNALAPGRVLAGIGAGDSAVFPIGLKPQRIAELRVGVERLGALMEGRAVPTPAGPVAVASAQDPRPPIFLAASQPHMLELAGAVADGVIVMGPSHPDVCRTQLEMVRNGATGAGRDVTAPIIDLWVTMAVGDGAVDAVRSWASAQARWLHRWEKVPDTLEPFREEMRLAAATYDFSNHLSVSAGHAGVVSDDFASRLAVVGKTEECRKRLSELAVLGADRITVTLMSGGRERRLDDILAVWEGIG